MEHVKWLYSSKKANHVNGIQSKHNGQEINPYFCGYGIVHFSSFIYLFIFTTNSLSCIYLMIIIIMFVIIDKIS